MPHVRRPRSGQADAPRAAGSRSAAQHPWRLLRAGSVQVQPGHVGRPDDVQPCAGAASSRSTRRGRICRRRARHAILYGHRAEDSSAHAARRQSAARRSRRPRGGLPRHRPPNRALLPALPPAGRSERADGSVARQGDGRAHLPRLPRSHASAPRGCSSPSRARRIHDLGQLHFDELHALLGHDQTRPVAAPTPDASAQGDSRPARAAARHRAGLPELQPPLGNALRRRIAAYPPFDADRLGPDGHALRARRAEHRPAPEGQRQDDRDARAGCATSATR